MFRLMIAFLFLTVISAVSYAAPEQPLNPYDLNISVIQSLTNLKGDYNDKEKLFKITAPRDDLAVTVNGVRLTSAMGLSSWASFKKIKDFTVMQGELVLTDTQVDPVMAAAITNHLSVTALHSHFLWETPKIMFMRVEGVGNEQDLAKSIGLVFAKIDATSKGMGEFPVATIDTSTTTLNPTQVNNIIRAKGFAKNGIYKVIVGGTKVNAQAVFAGSDNAAVVDGDFMVREADLQGVLMEFHKAKIQVVAIHQQLSNDGQLPVASIHFWGIGNTRTLAKGIRFAMNAARLYSKDQIVVQAAPTNKPVPTYSAKLVATVHQKLAQAVLPPQKLAQPLPTVPASIAVKSNPVQKAAQVVEAAATVVQPIAAPAPLPAARTHFKSNVVKGMLGKIKFGSATENNAT